MPTLKREKPPTKELNLNGPGAPENKGAALPENFH
jgi:hypothetical protein